MLLHPKTDKCKTHFGGQESTVLGRLFTMFLQYPQYLYLSIINKKINRHKRLDISKEKAIITIRLEEGYDLAYKQCMKSYVNIKADGE